MDRVYIAIGSNLNNPLFQVKSAIKELQQLPNTKNIIISSFYRSKPMGSQQQPNYLNAVISLDTDLPPNVIFKYTQEIELRHGRIRKFDRWGPRTLDLDIILYGQKIILTTNLIIPHYGLKERNFVLYPLLEIAPMLSFPNGVLLKDKLIYIKKNNLTLW
ncbi:MAG: 2-amino-4-hydroxy-6-hydroxymethyldihydropteridine diphosphokinase [Arsenophonus endosymbiont of Ceratovacuna japonica]